MRTLALCLALLASPALADEMFCETLLAIDGDTVKCNGQLLRPMGPGAPYVSGFDAPEIRNPDCNTEAKLGGLAMARMAELIELPGLTVLDSGVLDAYDRPLVWLQLPSGETVGEILMAEGLAREWLPKKQVDWCKGTS